MTPKEVLNFFLKTIDGIRSKIVFSCFILLVHPVIYGVPRSPTRFSELDLSKFKDISKKLIEAKAFSIKHEHGYAVPACKILNRYVI